jgi:hypothetical protein
VTVHVRYEIRCDRQWGDIFCPRFSAPTPQEAAATAKANGWTLSPDVCPRHQNPQDPPPFQPDPNLIGHMEGNKRLIRKWRNHARDTREAPTK